jgi:hypothetical protein
MSKNGVFDSDP